MLRYKQTGTGSIYDVMLNQPQWRSIWGGDTHSPRPFAEFILSIVEGLRVTPEHLRLSLSIRQGVQADLDCAGMGFQTFGVGDVHRRRT